MTDDMTDLEVVAAALGAAEAASEDTFLRVKDVAFIQRSAVSAYRARLRERVEAAHDEMCACPFDGTDPGCNFEPTSFELYALIEETR